MSDYAIFFDKDNSTYRLPTNPEQLEISSIQAIEKYEVLKLGQVAIPSHMELQTFNFECEFPKQAYHYVETSGGFKNADYYLKLFKEWRASLDPIRFIASNGIDEDINTLVLIEDLTIVEKAGEEGDKYVSFKLLEYKEFTKKMVVMPVSNNTAVRVMSAQEGMISPKANDTHTVVSGDTLWAIAKKYYGDGNKCNIIYNANKDKIKNPALIYPGQVLAIPGDSELSKYSASLPKMKTTEADKAGAIRIYGGGGRSFDTNTKGGSHTSGSGNTHGGGGRGF